MDTFNNLKNQKIMKLYLALENGMCLNYINLHNSQTMRLRDTPFTSQSLRFESIFYIEKDVPKLKALHPSAEIIKFNSHYHLNVYKNAMELS
jgi:hypothetical protein